MRIFVIKLILFGLVLLFVFLLTPLLTSYWVKRNDFKNDQTESNTLIMEKNKNYDLAFLGISHARNFSRYRNHERLERFLNKKILNLGQGASSCGANEQLFYLKYAYNNRKIKIDTLIY